jgi:hypothetical protein
MPGRLARRSRHLSPPPKKQKTGADAMTPGDLRHAAAWLKALSHEAALRLRVRPPTTASPRDHLDAAQRVAATVMDRHMPIFIVILTTTRCRPSLAQNDLAKPSSGISRGNGRWCRHDAHVQRMLTVLADLAALDSDSALRLRLRHYAGPRLLVIDEVGYLSYSNRHADLLFELVSRRYEHNSTIVTTNWPFAKWREVFPNAACGRLPRPLSSVYAPIHAAGNSRDLPSGGMRIYLESCQGVKPGRRGQVNAFCERFWPAA